MVEVSKCRERYLAGTLQCLDDIAIEFGPIDEVKLMGFCRSFYLLLGIECESVIQDLNEELKSSSISSWMASVVEASHKVYLASKERERGRNVPLGVRLSKFYRFDALEILEMFLEVTSAESKLNPMKVL